MEIIHELYSHTIFMVDQHKHLITKENKKQLYESVKLSLERLNCQLFEIGGSSDHIHFVHSFLADMSTDELIKRIKLSTQFSVQHDGFPEFYWDEGYYSYSVSKSLIEAESEEIRKQLLYHRNTTLDEELKQLRESLEMYETDDLTDWNENSLN